MEVWFRGCSGSNNWRWCWCSSEEKCFRAFFRAVSQKHWWCSKGVVEIFCFEVPFQGISSWDWHVWLGNGVMDNIWNVKPSKPLHITGPSRHCLRQARWSKTLPHVYTMMYTSECILSMIHKVYRDWSQINRNETSVWQIWISTDLSIYVISTCNGQVWHMIPQSPQFWKHGFSPTPRSVTLQPCSGPDVHHPNTSPFLTRDGKLRWRFVGVARRLMKISFEVQRCIVGDAMIGSGDLLFVFYVSKTAS